MIITTINNVPGKEIKEVYGFVSASTVRTKNIGKDIGASFKTLVGGEIKAYQEMMEEAIKIPFIFIITNFDNLLYFNIVIYFYIVVLTYSSK